MSEGAAVRNQGIMRAITQVVGIVRKELGDIARQPRLILVLALGPFVILLLFAGGYDEQKVVLRTLFVAPPDSIYADAIAEHEDELDRYLVSEGFTDDLAAARRAVADNDVDLVVVFPDDPAATVLSGEQATISVIHDKLDPIQKTAVEVSAQLAVLEVNASILEALVAEAQDTLAPLDESVARAEEVAERLGALIESGDTDAMRGGVADLDRTVGDIDRILSVSEGVVAELRSETDEEQEAKLEELTTTLDELQAVTARLEQAEVDDPGFAADSQLAGELVGRLRALTGEVFSLDPELVVRPFASDTETLLRAPVALQDFFAPSALALLVQHVVVTFAAMALVRDESLGLFEIYRVSPATARHVVTGKYMSFVIIGGAVAALSLVGVIAGLGVPMRGSLVAVVVAVALLVTASIGLGLLLSGTARTDLQAVQYAMLLLLAGLFFSGFFISLETLRYPVKLISLLLPVTFGIQILQDVMLRGESPEPGDVTALATQAVVYGGMGAWLMWRRLRVS